MMKGRPAIYATFSSYDEVAHHSGLERTDTLEALRKLDQQFARIERARPYAARPYEIVVLSDHGQTQGATFKQRNGYGLDELVERSLERGADVASRGGRGREPQQRRQRARRGDRQHRRSGSSPRTTSPTATWSCSAPGNLGLVYLMERAPPADARGDRRAAPAAAAGAARASPRRLAARPLGARRRRRARRATGRTTWRTAASRAKTRWRTSRRTRRGTCCARTASSTWPTSWSAASTTRRWTRGAPSRS